MLGSLFGSGLRAACAGASHSAAASKPTTAPQALQLMAELFPVLDFEFGLLRTLVIGDLQLQVLRAHALLEADVGGAPVVALVRTLAVEECHQLMLAGLEVADVQPLDTALEQRRDLARGVEVVADVLVV